MTQSQIELLCFSIWQNEGRYPNELTDIELCGYLIDLGYDDSTENVKLIRQFGN